MMYRNLDVKRTQSTEKWDLEGKEETEYGYRANALLQYQVN